MSKPAFAIIECERPRKLCHDCHFVEFLSDSKTVVGFLGGRFDTPSLISQWDAESGKHLKAADSIPYSSTWDCWTSPDSRLIAISQSKTVLANPDFDKTGERVRYNTIGNTYIVDTGTLKIRATLSYPISQAAFSGDGELMAVVDADKTIRIIKLKSNKELASRKVDGYVPALAFQPDPAELWIVEKDVVQSWNHRTDIVRESAKASGSNHAFSPDGKNLLYHGGTYKAFTPVVTDTTSWKSKKIGYFGKVRHLSLSPDASKLAIAAENTLVVWNLVEDCAWLKWKKPHYDNIRHAAFSPDGQRVACILNGGQVQIFDFREGAKDQLLYRFHCLHL